MQSIGMWLATAAVAGAAQVSINVNVSFNPQPPNPAVCFLGTTSGSSASFSCPSATYYYTHNPDTSVTGAASVSASAAYGLLSGLASGSITGDDNFAFDFGSIIANSTSSFSDNLTIAAPGFANGTAATYTLYMRLTGSSSEQVSGGDRAIFTEQLLIGGPNGVSTFAEPAGPLNQLVSVQFPITLGTPFGFGATLSLVAGVQGFGNTQPIPSPGAHNGAVAIDLSHTATFAGMQVVVGNQTLSPNQYSATAESGTYYATGVPGASAVPEPGTILLLAGGLATMYGFRKRRTL